MISNVLSIRLTVHSIQAKSYRGIFKVKIQENHAKLVKTGEYIVKISRGVVKHVY